MLILRHTSAGEKVEPPSADRARPLDTRGLADARRLPMALAGYPIERVVSSPHRRCVDSVRPLARDRGVDVEIREELAPDALLVDTRALLAELPDESIVCTHREVIERLFRSRLECEKGGIWVIQSRGARLVPVEYLPLPEAPGSRQPRSRKLVRSR